MNTLVQVTVGKLGQHTQTELGHKVLSLSFVLPLCSYAGRVVGSTLKAQRENPEMTVRNTDPVLKGAKQRLEQLTQVNTLEC